MVCRGRKQAAALRAAKLKKQDPDYFRKLAQKVRRRGRDAGGPTGFATSRELAVAAGKKSGETRRRRAESRRAGDDISRVHNDAGRRDGNTGSAGGETTGGEAK
nr:MAG TPA: hypothetical protein [Caudoviricetes sp.]